MRIGFLGCQTQTNKIIKGDSPISNSRPRFGNNENTDSEPKNNAPVLPMQPSALSPLPAATEPAFQVPTIQHLTQLFQASVLQQGDLMVKIIRGENGGLPLRFEPGPNNPENAAPPVALLPLENLMSKICQQSKMPASETIAVISAFLDMGLSPNKIDSQGHTPLTAAIHSAANQPATATGLIHLLVARGADVNQINGFHKTPLLYMAQIFGSQPAKTLPALKALLSYQPDPNKVGAYNENALYSFIGRAELNSEADTQAMLEAIRLLVAAGCNPHTRAEIMNRPTINGVSEPVSGLNSIDQLVSARLMRRQPNQPTTVENWNSAEALDILLSVPPEPLTLRNSRVGYYNLYALTKAAQKLHPQEYAKLRPWVEDALFEKLFFHIWTQTASFHHETKGDTQNYQALLKTIVDDAQRLQVSFDDKMPAKAADMLNERVSPTEWCAMQASPRALYRLLKAGANPNGTGKDSLLAITLLMFQRTFIYGMTLPNTPGRSDKLWDCLRLLLSHPDIDVNKPSENDITPLMLAVCTGNIPAVRMLLEAGANPTLRSQDTMTARALLNALSSGAEAPNPERPNFGLPLDVVTKAKALSATQVDWLSRTLSISESAWPER